MISSTAADRFRTIRYRPLRSGLWTWALFLMMAGGGYAFDKTSPAGPVRELRVGLAAHDVGGLWSGESKEKGPDLCAEVIFNRSLFHLLSATAYPSVGASINTRSDTSKVYGGFLLQWEPASPFFFSTGFSLALHDGELDTDSVNQKSLGSRVLFRIPIEIGYAVNPRHRIILAFDHVSNAYLTSPNEGMDTLGLVYGYRF
ncbi:MAG: acyloxyacyl hydrolase [Desulfosarcina sp.]|nr:acyloxyacyl hydrolase [Desulfosarcina sp.]MBC2745355.1 acyloxyacyl hydrolase [Desulfosarcina sp.]MBC2768260.1 acyloxyacyl hydrolase [Desulfosarcina sp.]